MRRSVVKGLSRIFDLSTEVGGAITAADPSVSITARYKKPVFGAFIPADFNGGYNVLKRDIVGRLGGDKWKDLDRKAKKLHRKLAAIDSRYNIQSNANASVGEKQNALSAWRKAVSTADPEVLDVVSVLACWGTHHSRHSYT
eukprot:SAG25_NODE_7244_length_493_cov_0.852792_1_plen_142_part_00